ncbi:MAG TPA: TIGR03619 family F420-dependent LLM class oxidoreductase [Acetobacteraceae bacterium]|jgi:probable F420-dependent oxidoreductase|nr:TIGR03619 family F420-dependent LLM class oxidoreductase [Acetobacteraceae bacterium]
MQIGFNAPTTGALIEPDSLRRIITEGEALGFDYTTVSDHIMVPRNLGSKYPYTDSGEFPAGTAAAWLEQLTTTAYIAALTSKLRFVMSVMVVPHRPAVLTAKMLATIDYLSKGRLTLGIGVGWCREEFEAIAAAPFDDRGHVTDEWMMACKELWSHDEPHFDGRYVKFSDVVFTPKPVQQPIPIWVGGESAPALRRTVRYADCWYPVGTNPQFPMNTLGRFKAGLARFRGFAERGGRDPASLEVALRVLVGPSTRSRRTIDGEAEMFTGGAAEYVADIGALAELGVSAVDVRLFAPTLDATIDNMRRFRDEVMAKVR